MLSDLALNMSTFTHAISQRSPRHDYREISNKYFVRLNIFCAIKYFFDKIFSMLLTLALKQTTVRNSDSYLS